ncbi:Retrovirus-related Pol polyprotein from transposon TNT 1-94 [Gossypium australe]|uniref:Retrovirus-related Pol polyprotein from transposon TNT 1-94 n=1 Tax=Gossypium australe TaxID=47621 RepID=A0A5B6W0Q0_9ROSI|nr:Retrovirus-related Pol polyprotein from transposon TNT 1-94 [Gossypium australe]
MGCSNHVTGDFMYLTNVKEVVAYSIGLPDVQTVVATQEGIIKLTNKIYLKHDLHSRELIAVSERRDGLYYFRQVSTIKTVLIEASSSLELWHRRLGHPSGKVVKLLPYVKVSWPTTVPPLVTLQLVSLPPVVYSSSSDDTVIQRALGEISLSEASGFSHSYRHKEKSISRFTSLRVFLRIEPQSFKEAVNDAGWRNVMQKEIHAQKDNDTWSMETFPPGRKALGSKWVYKIKYNSDRSIDRLKARIVFFGNH